MSAVFSPDEPPFHDPEVAQLRIPPHSLEAEASVLGGLLLDLIPRRRIPLIFVFGSLGVAVAVLLAINSTDRYAAAYWLTAASL